jgi:hypothetical protein
MSTIEVTVKAIRVYSDAEGVMYHVTFDKTFDGLVNENEEFIDSQVNSINFAQRYLLYACRSFIKGANALFNAKLAAGKSIGCAEIEALLTDAKMYIVRDIYEAGEEYIDHDGVVRTHEFRGYSKTIVGIEPDNFVKEQLSKFRANVLSI